MSRTPCWTPSAQHLLDPCARPAQPSPAAGPEGDFSTNGVTCVLLICFSSAYREGSPMACSPTQAIGRPLSVSGIQCRCPPAQKRAPFVRGCAPNDAGPSHDMGRVCLLTADGSSDDRDCQSAHGWLLLLPEPKALRLGAFLLPINVPARPLAWVIRTGELICTLNLARRCCTAACAAASGREPRVATARH